jgi:hypothetical protein
MSMQPRQHTNPVPQIATHATSHIKEARALPAPNNYEPIFEVSSKRLNDERDGSTAARASNFVRIRVHFAGSHRSMSALHVP